MPTLGLSAQEIGDVISFLGWIGNVDLNGWPPRPILVAGASVRGLPGVEGVPDSAEPVLRGKAVFNGVGGCAACHSVAADVALVGPSLAGVPERAARIVTDPAYTGHAKTARDYIRESLSDPTAYIAVAPRGRVFSAAGQSLMPSDYTTRLSERQIDDLVDYLMTLRDDQEEQP